MIIAAVSLVRLAEICGTPCVHTDEAQGRQRPGTDGLASVVVAEVTRVAWHGDLRLHVTLNADLSGCRADVARARLIGRHSHAYPASAILEADSSGAYGFATYLPADIRPGDLLVVPCRGITLVRDIQLPQHSS